MGCWFCLEVQSDEVYYVPIMLKYMFGFDVLLNFRFFFFILKDFI